MNFSHSEEAFVLSSLKEFVRSWGSGSQANFNLECRKGQAWVQLAFQLEHPTSPHHHHVQYPPQTRRHKGPARKRKDQARAEAHRSSKLVKSAEAAVHVTDSDSADTLIAASVAPTDESDSNSPNHQNPAVLAVQEESVAATQPSLQLSAVPVVHSPQQLPPVAAPAAGPSSAPPQPAEVVPVFGTVVFENCPVDILTEEYGDSLRRFVTSEDHLMQNITGTEIYPQSSRGFRNGGFTHTAEVVLHVRTGRL